MVPSLFTWTVSLQPGVFNGEQVRKDAALVHGDAEQLRAALTTSCAELLAGCRHGLVLSLQLELASSSLRGLVQVPGAVDSPVS